MPEPPAATRRLQNMWTLENDGDVLQNKRIWLRPGKKYLFGRSKADCGGFEVHDKTISRKHMTLEVSNVKPGDGSNIRTKSMLVIEDLNSKLGTLLDGQQIRGQSITLDSDLHEIKLGGFAHLFRVKWQPVVLSFSFSSKEQKNKDPLQSTRSRLEGFDIKTIIPYVVGSTTHVVASKRNTAKGLQALVNGQYVVAGSFVDAIEEAATVKDPIDVEALSLLEKDFESAWPNPLQHIPTQGKEPNPRSESLFAPDTGRATIFEGYTFVFCEQSQFESLQPPITNGGGKALYYGLDMSKTTADDVVQYVRSVAGERRVAKPGERGNVKPTVLVRFRGNQETADWCNELGEEIGRKLDQRLIEQSEFLDAILTKNPTNLWQKLIEGEGNPSAPPSEHQLAENDNMDLTEKATSQISAAITQSPNKRVRSRRAIVSRFKGFDDDFDPSSLPVKKAAEPSHRYEISQNHTSGPKELIASPGDDMDVDIEQPAESAVQESSTRKRSAISDPEDEAGLVDELLPAAAAMKKRRLEEEKENQRKGVNPEKQGLDSSARTQTQGKGQEYRVKSKRQIDLIGVARERREEQEAAARQEQEDLAVSLGGMSVEQMKNLAQIEEMEVRDRPDRSNRLVQYGYTGTRWDEKWNGRQNFKKFRRQGGGNHTARNSSLIVGLEEVKKKDFGIGDEYWLDSDKRKKKGRKTESQIVNSGSQQNSVERSQLDTGIDTEMVMSELPIESQPNRSDGGRHSTTRAISAISKKRVAPSQASNPLSTKRQKQKQLFVRDSESEDSGDELKFKFRKKK